jgi:hypothetical protein
MASDVSKLEASFTTLEAFRLIGFRNQDWCRFIDYPRGSFTNLPEGTDGATCNLFEGKALPFDDQAQQDFAAVGAALADAGWRGKWVTGIEYGGNGHVQRAEFDWDGGSFDRWSYWYEPGLVPENLEGEVEYTPISDGWWFRWEDWN